VQVSVDVSQVLLEQVQSASEVQALPVQVSEPATHVPLLVSQVSPAAQSESLVHPPPLLASPGTQKPLPSQMSPAAQSESLEQPRPPCTHSPAVLSHASPAAQSASLVHEDPATTRRQYPVKQTEPAPHAESAVHTVAVTVPPPWWWQEKQNSAKTTAGNTRDQGFSFMTLLRATRVRRFENSPPGKSGHFDADAAERKAGTTVADAVE
jgi:hypothetical protein